MNQLPKIGDTVRHVLYEKYPRTAKIVSMEWKQGHGFVFDMVAHLDGIIRDIDHYDQDDPQRGYWEHIADLEKVEVEEA